MARKKLWEASGHDVQMIAMVGSHTHSGLEITHVDPIRKSLESGISTHFVDIEMPGASGWDREFAQRNALRSVMLDLARKNDLIISTDADELVDPGMAKTIERSCHAHGKVSLSMLLLYYGLDWVDSGTWIHGKAFLGSNIPDDLSALRNDLARYAVPGCGWHISWQGGKDARSSKAMAFSHSEFGDREGIAAIELGAKHGFDPHGNKLLHFDSSILPRPIIEFLGAK